MTRSIFATIAFAAEAIILVDVLFANFDLIRQCFLCGTTVIALEQARNTVMASGALNKSYHTLRLTPSPDESIEPPANKP